MQTFVQAFVQAFVQMFMQASRDNGGDVCTDDYRFVHCLTSDTDPI